MIIVPERNLWHDFCDGKEKMLLKALKLSIPKQTCFGILLCCIRWASPAFSGSSPKPEITEWNSENRKRNIIQIKA